MTGNQFAEVLVYNHCSEAVEYLIFTRRCEPHVQPVKDPWKPGSRDREGMQKLISEGLEGFEKTRSHFFRMRYAYQIVRLAHYMGDWQQAIDLYNRLLPQVQRKRPSIVYWWVLGHQAGALFRLKKYPEAAYRFALIFQNCASKRAQAYRSFWLPDDASFQKTLSFCQNDRERSIVYALRCGSSHATVADLEKLWELDPRSTMLEMMLVSDVQQLEKIYLTTPVSEKKFGRPETSLLRKSSGEHLLALKKLVERVAKSGNAAHPRLWRAMDGYLEILAGDFYAAEPALEAAEQGLGTTDEDKAMRQQLDIWQLLLKLCQIDPAAAGAEDQVFAVKGFAAFKKQPDFEPFLRDWMANRYAETRQPGKSALEGFGWRGLRMNPTLPEIDDLIRAAQSQNLSRMEDVLLRDSMGNALTGVFWDMRATYLLSQNQPEAAAAAMRNIPEVERNKELRFSPFKERINDCVNCPSAEAVIDRRDLVEELIKLDFEAKAALDGGAADFYKLGLAWYNMTYFGPAWRAMDNFRSGASWDFLSRQKEGVFPMPGTPHGNRENLSCLTALGYFRQAINLSKDPELTARAAFMAAKCQLNEWYCSPSCKYRPGSRLVPDVPPEYREYFQFLKKNCSKTAFCRDAVSECKWFRAYAAR